LQCRWRGDHHSTSQGSQQELLTIHCTYQALDDAALPEVLVVLGEAQVERHHQPWQPAGTCYTLYCTYQALNDAALPEVLVVLGEAQVEGHHQPWQRAGATIHCTYQALDDAALPEVLVVLGEAEVEGHHQPWQPAGAHQEHPEWETEHQQQNCGQRCSV
jgi:hypothetical protein